MKVWVLFNDAGQVISAATPGTVPHVRMGVKPRSGERLLEVEMPDDRKSHQHHLEILRQYKVEVSSGKPKLVQR